MPDKSLNTNYTALKKDVLSFFNEDHSKLQLVVTRAQQEVEINLLKETIPHERFFFVVNMLNFEIQERYGIQKWLGYPEKEFSFKQYWDAVIHPSKKFLFVLARHMYDATCNGKYPLQFMVQRFASLVPLKHYNGHYLLTKKTASPFQYDINNRLISYIDEFTIIGNYDGEPLQPRMYNFLGEKSPISQQEMIQKVLDNFIGMKVFTISELQVARKLAYNSRITQAEIAKEFKVAPHTIDTYYKRFLNKARDFFDKDFLTACDAANFLKKEGLL